MSIQQKDERLLLVWSRKWLILIISCLVALAVFFALSQRQKTYSATATVQVSLLQTRGVGQANVLAANTLAAQYAQVATSQPVVAAASSELGLPTGTVRKGLSAGPIDSYNVIGVTATDTSSERSAARAVAVASALVEYVSLRTSEALRKAQEAGAARQATLDQQILELQEQIRVDSARARGSGDAAANAVTALTSQRNLLATLTAQRDNVFTATQRDLAVSQPILTVLDVPTTGSVESSNAPLFAGLSLLLSLALGCELVVAVARLRRVRSPSGRSQVDPRVSRASTPPHEPADEQSGRPTPPADQGPVGRHLPPAQDNAQDVAARASASPGRTAEPTTVDDASASKTANTLPAWTSFAPEVKAKADLPREEAGFVPEAQPWPTTP